MDVLDQRRASEALADVEGGVAAPPPERVLDDPVIRVEGVDAVGAVLDRVDPSHFITGRVVEEDPVLQVVPNREVLNGDVVRAVDDDPVLFGVAAVQDRPEPVDALDDEPRRRHHHRLAIEPWSDDHRGARLGGVGGLLDRREVPRHHETGTIVRRRRRGGRWLRWVADDHDPSHPRSVPPTVVAAEVRVVALLVEPVRVGLARAHVPRRELLRLVGGDGVGVAAPVVSPQDRVARVYPHLFGSEHVVPHGHRGRSGLGRARREDHNGGEERGERQQGDDPRAGLNHGARRPSSSA